MRRFYCQPCNHRWWQHRDPDPRTRLIGLMLAACGLLNMAAGIFAIVTK